MAEVKIPGSKSVTNRALFLSACASGLSYLRRPLISDDTEAFSEGLTALGYQLQWSGDDVALMGSTSGPPAASGSTTSPSVTFGASAIAATATSRSAADVISTCDSLLTRM